jgi:uracil-DNA glycosylase
VSPTTLSLASWQPLLEEAYASLSTEYRNFLETNSDYFPTQENYFNAFKTLEKENVKYILFGQDPYPRVESAGGYAFIDTNVKTLFSPKGLSKEVNRATSLRNFIKMALVASGDLKQEDTSQDAIVQVDKSQMIDSIDALRKNFEKNGVLLLNTALIFTDKKSSNKHVKAWRSFMQTLLKGLEREGITLILFGTHAKELKKHLPLERFETIELEHPYNHTFISNPKALKLFGEMKLLEK